ncbi:hypothetical protein JCM11491_006409 [Sporobolomyces phaffii]
MSTFTQALDPATLAKTRDSIRIMKEYEVVWLTILLWDTLATLPAEWTYIHRAKWTPLKIMFLVNRWFTVAAQASTAFLLLAPISPDVCRRIFWGFASDGIAVMFFCDCIIAIRVYAVYEKSRKMLYILVGMLAADLGLMVGGASQLRPVVYSDELREALAFKGCAAVIPNGPHAWLISILYWAPPLIFNLVALALIFHRNLQLARQAGRVPILQRMLKDGLFFFLVIMAANIVNVVLEASQTSPAIKNLNIPASITLTSLMCSRLVLSLHQHNSDVRRSQAGYGGGTLDHITSGGPGPASLARPSQISYRTRPRTTSRSHLDDCVEAADDDNDDDDDDGVDADGETTEGNTTAHEAEAGSSDSVDDDKVRYSSSSSSSSSPLPPLAAVAIGPPAPPHHPPLMTTTTTTVPILRDSTFLSLPPPVGVSLGTSGPPPRRRDSTVSFASPEDAV